MVIESIILIVWLLLATIGTVAAMLKLFLADNTNSLGKLLSILIALIWLGLIWWSSLAFIGLAVI